jgi:hypothetical protein
LEFEQLWAQLLARSPLPLLVVAVTLARAKEIRLRGVMSSSSTVLDAPTASPALALASTLAPIATPLAQGCAVAAIFCRYCKAMAHTIEKCRRHIARRRGGARAIAAPVLPQSPPDWALYLTWRMERMKHLCATLSASFVVSSVTTRVP